MTTTIPSIQRKITVGAPAERAFKIFTESLATWWPAGYHIGQADFADVVMQPQVGGRWFEAGTDGSECDWGRVLVWEPPHRLVVTWQINGNWEFDADPARASEIEVRFTELEPGQTTVELEHRYLDRLVAGQAAYAAVSDDSGWNGILARFAETVTDQS
ncbi:ATPase [Rhizocola hellebori]|uniref:ATPase n=1 Tax=Rhizocola hellebori TaxID=1392758 RepID=A0A8J3Q4E1_9ACTN|nr:SRPBCC family protein [Rhizocola hellebori]GIH03272.1 ATPase [Rhizocola hellebori]